MENKMTREQALRDVTEAEAKLANAKASLSQNPEVKQEGKLGIAIMSRLIAGRVVFQSTKTTMKEAVEEAVASGADLCGADLCDADLSDADLRGADLCGADLSDADLCEANLRGADLCGANLCGADLCGADLRGAEMMGAKFYGRGGISSLKRHQLSDFLAALGFIIED